MSKQGDGAPTGAEEGETMTDERLAELERLADAATLVALRLEIERLRAVERAARTYCREPTDARFREMTAAIVDYRTPPPGYGPVA